MFPELKFRFVVVTCPGLFPGAMIPVPVPVRLPIEPVPFRVPPETSKLVVLAVELLIFTTPVVTLVVVLVLAPEIVVKPEPEVMGVKLKVPEPKLETVPGSRILPLPAFRVLFTVKETAAKFMASPDVETLVFRIAALATVNALLNKDAAVAKATPVPPAVNVVVPVIVPPPETAFTVIAPAPAAVIFNEPAAVIKASSELLRFNPPVALPKDTFTPESLVIPIAPVTFIAAPIETSAALEIVSAESSVELPTVSVKVTVPAPAVRPRDCAPLIVLLKSMLLLVVARATLAPKVTASV